MPILDSPRHELFAGRATAPADGARRFRDLEVDLVQRDAPFTSDGTVTVGDAGLKFRRAVIATGACAGVRQVAAAQAVTNGEAAVRPVFPAGVVSVTVLEE